MTSTKTKIVDFLNKTPEATAKKIAAGVKEEPTFVINALNALRTEAVVECEKRKGSGNELIYWLAKPVAVETPKMKPAISVPSPSMALLSEVNALQERLDDIAEALRETRIAMFETASGADKNLAEHIRTLSISYHAAIDRAGKAEKTLAACEIENRQADNRLDEWMDMASTFVADPENPEDLHAFITKTLESARTELSHHQNVAKAACSDLAAISRSLFIDPDIGGAKPILAAIQNIISQRDAWRDSIGNISGEDTPESASRHFAEINSELSRLRAENVALKTLNKEMPGFGAAHEKIKREKQRQPRRPFSVTGLTGYYNASPGKVTLFLDRRLNARSVTLTVDKLEKLAGMAVSYP